MTATVTAATAPSATTIEVIKQRAKRLSILIAMFRAVHSSTVLYPSDAISLRGLRKPWRVEQASIICERPGRNFRFSTRRTRSSRFPDSRSSGRARKIK
jgi:hypothetical protein